jgi:DNA-binding MarR family transcriptional regulator
MPRNAKTTPKSVAVKAPDAHSNIESVFTYHLQILANISTRIALLSIKPKFGLNIMQWRVLANIDRLEVATIQDLARASGVLVSQVSRTISGLDAKGLVKKRTNPKDGRSRAVSLTSKGEALVQQILEERRLWNDEMLRDLSPAEREQLMTLILRVEKSSRSLYSRLRREAGGEPVIIE